MLRRRHVWPDHWQHQRRCPGGAVTKRGDIDMLRFLGWTGLIIFLIGLLVVLGLLKLIF